MLNCKDFVQQSGNLIDNEQLTIGQKINNKLHLFLCHHCRNYVNQAITVASLSNNLELEPAAEQLIEESVSKMKQSSSD
jgi:uncharacterized protein YlaI